MSKSSQLITEAYTEFKEGAEVLNVLANIPMEEKVAALKMASAMLGQTFDLTYIENLQLNCKKIESSTKFRLPFNGSLMEGVADDKSFAYVVKNFLQAQRLPFPLIALEFESDIPHHEDVPCKGVVILAEEIERPDRYPLINIKVFKKIQLRAKSKYSWSNLKYEYVLDFEKISSDSDDLYDFIKIKNWELTSTPNESKLEIVALELRAFLEFMLALSCKNLEVRKSFPPSPKENAYRVRKGLPEYPQYNEVVLSVSSSGKTTKTGLNPKGSGGGIKSPHLRRGHIRRLDDKVVWVTPAVINAGSTDKSAKQKSYNVK